MAEVSTRTYFLWHVGMVVSLSLEPIPSDSRTTAAFMKSALLYVDSELPVPLASNVLFVSCQDHWH